MTTLDRTRSDIVLLATLSLLGVALALKMLRYVDQRPDSLSEALLRIDNIMAAEGWMRATTAQFSDGMPLEAATFVKPGCAATTVTLLGRKVELKRYVSRLYGDDVVFVHDGRPRDDATAGTEQVARLRRLFDRALGGNDSKPLPLLAVTPAPRDPGCSSPLIKS